MCALAIRIYIYVQIVVDVFVTAHLNIVLHTHVCPCYLHFYMCKLSCMQVQVTSAICVAFIYISQLQWLVLHWCAEGLLLVCTCLVVIVSHQIIVILCMSFYVLFSDCLSDLTLCNQPFLLYILINTCLYTSCALVLALLPLHCTHSSYVHYIYFILHSHHRLNS